MKCMPELPKDQPDAGQVARSSRDAPSHSLMRGKMTDTNGMVSAQPLTEVSTDELTADEFDQLVSNEFNSENDSDDGLQACNLLLHEEDNFDTDRL